jgi:predicted  nucleic acid-binding Zn-ribbon protein
MTSEKQTLPLAALTTGTTHKRKADAGALDSEQGPTKRPKTEDSVTVQFQQMNQRLEAQEQKIQSLERCLLKTGRLVTSEKEALAALEKSLFDWKQKVAAEIAKPALLNTKRQLPR